MTRPDAMNPVVHFEIPVRDLERASRFYAAVFQVTLERQVIDGYEMALFPFDEGGAGASGALAKGDVYVPTLDGAILYFRTDDIDGVLARARASGGRELLSKTAVGPNLVAEFADSEGNRIAITQRR